MAHRHHQPSLSDVRVVAVYPSRVVGLVGRPRTLFRQRQKRQLTVAPCRIEALDGRSVAIPEYEVPAETSPPRYRIQVETVRAPVGERRTVLVVLSGDMLAPRRDPEQAMLSPIFDDGHRMILEFQRAHVLIINARGHLETRFIAVHPFIGTIGTKTIHRFDMRYLGLAIRCADHLGGAVELYPYRERQPRGPTLFIPDGVANLRFDSGKTRRASEEEARGAHRLDTTTASP